MRYIEVIALIALILLRPTGDELLRGWSWLLGDHPQFRERLVFDPGDELARELDFCARGVDAWDLAVGRAGVRDSCGNAVPLGEYVVDGNAGIGKRLIELLVVVRKPLGAAMGVAGLMEHDILPKSVGARSPILVVDCLEVASEEAFVLVRWWCHTGLSDGVQPDRPTNATTPAQRTPIVPFDKK